MASQDSANAGAAQQAGTGAFPGASEAAPHVLVPASELVKMTAAIAQLTQTVSALQASVDRLAVASGIDAAGGDGAELHGKAQRFYAFHQNAVAGGLALPLSFAVMHPVDTIKTRMQAVNTKIAGNGSFFTHARSAFQSAGVAMLQRGFLTSVAGAAPQGALRLGTYGVMQQRLDPYFDSPVLRNAIGAIVGDVASSVVKVPREVLVQRLQTGIYSSLGEAVRSVIKAEGWRGLFTGYVSTTLRDIPFMVVLFTSYEQFKLWKIRLTLTTTHHRGKHDVDKEWSDLETVLWGGISGGLAGFSTTPLDVVKTRIMTETKKGANRKLTHHLSTIFREEGPRGLFVGAMPRSGWWFCVCSIFFFSFERVRAKIPAARGD